MGRNELSPRQQGQADARFYFKLLEQAAAAGGTSQQTLIVQAGKDWRARIARSRR